MTPSRSPFRSVHLLASATTSMIVWWLAWMQLYPHCLARARQDRVAVCLTLLPRVPPPVRFLTATCFPELRLVLLRSCCPLTPCFPPKALNPRDSSTGSILASFGICTVLTLSASVNDLFVFF